MSKLQNKKWYARKECTITFQEHTQTQAAAQHQHATRKHCYNHTDKSTNNMLKKTMISHTSMQTQQRWQHSLYCFLYFSREMHESSSRVETKSYYLEAPIWTHRETNKDRETQRKTKKDRENTQKQRHKQKPKTQEDYKTKEICEKCWPYFKLQGGVIVFGLLVFQS